MHRILLLLVALILFSSTACAQEVEEVLGDMTVAEYEPRSTLVVDENIVTSAKFPFVDVHSHWFRAPTMTAGAIDTLIMEMDEMNMGVLVNLSGGWGENLAGAVSNMEARYPDRIVTFANVNFNGVGGEGWTENAVAQLRTDIEAGARGLKVYKNLGLDVKDVDGNRVAVNDPRIDPIWALAGEMGVPVLIHSAEPASFWLPRDKYNEKWLELKLRPNRFRPADEFETFETIMGEHFDIMSKHPGTTFITAHMAWYGGNLAYLGEMFDKYPNLVADMAAVIYEFGRQPRNAREFMIEYKDRLLFGKDTYRVSEFWTYFRTFETEDEYFPYYRKYHAQWRLYGLGLPDDVLEHIYYKNAVRVIPGLEESMFQNN